MPDKLAGNDLREIGAFLEGMADLTANTGVSIDFHTAMPITVGEERTGLVVSCDVDQDDVVRYYARRED